MWFKYAKYYISQNLHISSNLFKFAFVPYEEYWVIDKDVEWAGNGGDKNHITYVIDYILAQHDMEDIDISELTKEEALEKGLSQEEIDVITNKIDPREYAMKKLGWIRVAGLNAQMYGISLKKLNDLCDALYEIYYDFFEEDEEENMRIDIEDIATGNYYLKVPLKDLDEMVKNGNITRLMRYKFG